MWFLKIKSMATGEYQIIEKSDDLKKLLKEADRLVAKGIEIQITAEKKSLAGIAADRLNRQSLNASITEKEIEVMVEIIEEITLEDELKDILTRNATFNLRIKQGKEAKEELALNEKRMKEIMKKLLEV